MSICSGALSAQPLSLQSFSSPCGARYTMCIQLVMKRAFFLSCIFLMIPFRLSAQSNAQNSAPPVMESAYGQKLKIPGIHNGGKINEVLYRGAQPKEQGLSELKKLGVTPSSISAARTAKKSHGNANR